jgi:hypothetical protein
MHMPSSIESNRSDSNLVLQTTWLRPDVLVRVHRLRTYQRFKGLLRVFDVELIHACPPECPESRRAATDCWDVGCRCPVEKSRGVMFHMWTCDTSAQHGPSARESAPPRWQVVLGISRGEWVTYCRMKQ